MSITFDGEFVVPGEPDAVMGLLMQVERMARCMPGASLEGQNPEGDWQGVMTVAFGPKKIRFKGSLGCDFDPQARTGTLRGRGAADLRAARFAGQTRFAVASAEPGPNGTPQSRVSIACEADLQGVLADFARTGGVAVARVLMQDFARRLAAELSAGGDASQPAGDNAVSGARVMWDVVKDRSAGLVQKLGPKKDGAS